MAVVIQRLEGAQHDDRFYPDFAGAARSHNFYPTAPQKSEDRIASVALGLGMYVTAFHVELPPALFLISLWLFVGWAVALARLIASLLIRGERWHAVATLSSATLLPYVVLILLLASGRYILQN